MRPISLKIKGLNSFIEEQVIDFEKLTDRGLFGIFGPTGSGKSTILDGITLALYGKVARESKNYINANCQSAFVSFEFQISGKETKKYCVQREFKTDKKTGNARTGKAKIIEITSTTPLVLADKVDAVTSACKEIIGLDLQDFTRTVVLPQGKFSEFLKLEGKTRRDMLERLFNLQEYGDNLARKLAREVNNQKAQYHILSGELKGYEEVNETTYKEKETKLKGLVQDCTTLIKEVEHLEKEYLEKKEVYGLQLEALEYEKKQQELKEKASEIQGIEEKVKKAERAQKVVPYIQAFEKTKADLTQYEVQRKKLQKLLEELILQKEEVKKQYENAKEDRDVKLPSLQIKFEKAREGLEEKKQLDELECIIEDLNKKIIENKSGLAIKQENQVIVVNQIMQLQEQIKGQEAKLETLKVDVQYREKVQQGVQLIGKGNEVKKVVEELKERTQSICKKIEEGRLQETELKVTYEEKRKRYEEKKLAHETLIKNCPCTQEDLLTLQQQVSNAAIKQESYTKLTQEIKKLDGIMEENRTKKQEQSVEHSHLEGQLKTLKEQLKEIEVQNLALQLRESLVEGEICPVCGSKEAHKELLPRTERKPNQELEQEIQSKEAKLRNMHGELTRIDTTMDMLVEQVSSMKEEIKALGDEPEETYLEDIKEKFKGMQQASIDYEQQRKSLEEEVAGLKEEVYLLEKQIANVCTRIEQYQNQQVVYEGDYKKQTEELEALKEMYNAVKAEVKVDNFKRAYNEILEAEKESAQITQDTKVARVNLQEMEKMKEKLDTKINQLKEDEARCTAILLEKQKSKSDKLTSLKEKVQDIDHIPQLLEEIQEKIEETKAKYLRIEQEKEEKDKNHQRCNEELIQILGNISQLCTRKAREELALEEQLKLQKITSVEEVKQQLLGDSKIEALKVDIKNYQVESSKVKGALESVVNKLANRAISEEEWKLLQEQRYIKEQEKVRVQEERIKLEEEVRVLGDKLIEQKELIKRKETMEHKLGILSHLEKVFKGKKFVEFVAATRLKYVSIEASKKLKEITNGNYGLEADENGKFIIRDYKNGGVARDASTLSGGETFLASLALALSLSAEIQLKGTSALELFFLDEGFGTLDDNLLEVVMTSLERIHNDKLKIGLISHVESIKNRVPVKLLVTPAIAGKGGSKVKIERN